MEPDKVSNSGSVGISMVIVSACTSLYYNMILAWSYYYMFSSFTSVLPWSNCDNPWNTRDCSLKLPIVVCDQNGQTQYLNGTCFSNNEFVGLWNDTLFVNTTGRKRISAAEEYWNNEALKMSSSFEDFGTPKWQLVLCLMLAWIVCFFCLIKGIKSTGKVVYFTAVFPYVVLLILFFRGVTLENAGEGIYFYIVPKFERLADPRVWKDAAVQIFFSMSIAGGGLVTLSSYNRFHNNILKDSIIVSVGDTLTCIFAGFVIFSYLGYMAGQLNVSVEKVAQDGAGLAFIVYPQAVMSLPPSQLWSILFFFMLITLGLDSQFAMLETVLTGVMDQFPHLRHQKSFIIGIICIIFFLLGIPLTCNGGMYLLQLMDNYVGGWTLLLIGFVEVVCVAYVYGATRFLKDIEVMLGFPQSKWWLVCWLGISPLTLVVIFVFTFIDYQPSSYGDYNYSTWADALGWVMAVLCIIAIPITMLYMINKEDEASGLLGKLKLLITPARDWGPSLVKHRKLVTYVDGWVIDPYVEKNPRAYLNMAFSPESKRDIRLSPSNVTLSSKRTYDNRSFENSQSEYDTGSYISDYTLMSFESAV
ncbi:hypothetical protein KUTeg_020418 [Tegillarca granosa]|uniref:Uncharacterized protein n=1 Tax=Tegillarca granosa TaxID=220873 RepID=A0ABQ9E7U2_TEGGR|nr:hypothetical protein KUTeg_020418 [Tegillarca granosa]